MKFSRELSVGGGYTISLKLLRLFLKKMSKGKVFPSQAIKAYRKVEVKFQSFLNPALVGSERSASHSGRFTPRERTPVLSGDRVGPGEDMDALEKIKISYCCPECSHDVLVVQS
jgi:hypothetical protein